MKIQIVDYKLFDYEKKFLEKEIESIGGKLNGEIKRNTSVDIGKVSLKQAINLTYIKGVFDGDNLIESTQYKRESINGGKRVQSRRYGPHGLHEYKGRFNPQLPRSLILSNFRKKDNPIILDPFVGSGTTSVEARGLGLRSVGVELNSFARMLGIAKKYYEEINEIPAVKINSMKGCNYFKSETKDYLLRWFPVEQFNDLESILSYLDNFPEKEQVVLKIILSDLLRTHSYQDPKDLRIRRQKVITEQNRLLDDFLTKLQEHKLKHARWIKIAKQDKKLQLSIIHGDATRLNTLLDDKVNGTVSSPPYVAALPYVDTYRLSMVALGLLSPKDIGKTEKSLIGARDINSYDKENLLGQLKLLPNSVKEVINFILKQTKNNPKAGFRKKAVPFILANYACSMLEVLKELLKIELNNANNFWVLGPNRIKLNNNWYYINTPEIVGNLAKFAGFKKVSILPIQAYVRYNIHSKNSINKESILHFISS